MNKMVIYTVNSTFKFDTNPNKILHQELEQDTPFFRENFYVKNFRRGSHRTIGVEITHFVQSENCLGIHIL